jgi:uncharacterized protein
MLTPEQIEAICARSENKVESLRRAIRSHGSALVAFSGGVDSAFVLKVAADELGKAAVALTALSPSVPSDEQEATRAFAEKVGVEHIQLDSRELNDPRYAANPINRCYFCKSELYTICERVRAERGLAVIFDGFNADDRRDHRPGHQAAKENQVLSPLAAAGLTKEEIRAWSSRLGLPTWDKPQAACLASRIPYGTAVTQERLLQLDGAESDLRRLGLRTFRVRYHGEVARLEVAAEEQSRFESADFRRSVDAALKARGFTFVALDLEPFRSGRMNDALSSKPERFPLPTLPASGAGASPSEN